MTANNQDRLIPLELTLDTLTWLRAFLKEEIIAAEIDHEEVERLHTDAAIRAAKAVLSQEHDRMAKAIDALDATIGRDDRRESLSRQIAAMTPPVA